MSELSDRIAGLSAEKRALLARMLRSKEPGAEPEGPSVIASRPDREAWPLSYAQERFWFLQRYAPESAFYNDFTPVRLEGPLHLGALSGALDSILWRHEVLRARFSEVDGQPVQTIQPYAQPYLAAVDLSALPEPLRDREARRWIAAEAERPFDLTRGPLLRSVLLRHAPEEHSLLLSMHHIATDGWSWALLMRELGAFYGAFVEFRPPQLPELPIQYADYAAWQRRWLGHEVLEKQLAFWREALLDLPAALDLPVDRPRPAVPALRGASASFAYPRTLLASLEDLGRRRAMTSFMVLLAAFQALLGRYAGQDDVAVGTPITGRSHAATHRLIGVFINMLVLRVRMADDPTFLELLERVRQVTLEAYDHQDLPFDHLVEALRPNRSSGHQPLFQVLFAVQDEGTGNPLDLPGIVASPIAAAPPAAKYDLFASLSIGVSGVQGWLGYDADLFDSSTIVRFLRHFGRLLEAVAESPERRLSEILLVDEAENHQISREWNDSAAEVLFVGVPELLTRQAERFPDSPAVVSDDQQICYRELEERSGRLARLLCQLGVGPEVVVALCLERSVDLVIALLAVLRAGGAYLPLDPAYPEERLSFLISDSRCSLLLAQRGMAFDLPEGCRRLDLDEDWIDSETEGAKLPDPRVSAESLAYIIYTSGSTGRPKGVGVPHAGLVNLISWHLSTYLIGPGDRTSQIAGIAFDASVWEIWPPLLAGACLCFVGEETRTDPDRLADWLAESRIAVAFAPTPIAELLLQRSWPERPGLRFLLTGGEALRRRPAADLGFRLVNHYGPTENSVVATAGAVEPAEPDGAPSFPPAIGKPIGNVRIYIADGSLELAPLGAAGELLIAGESLARGYLHRPDLTAERFIPDSWGGDPGERLYRTGDLVRWLPQGELLFVGRVDRQVKLRGFRIELGEIEAVLLAQPSVREAVVEAVATRAGEKRLVAYVVLELGAAASLAGLRAALRQRLPDYMVPAAWVALDALPLTPNGKVDRRALPEPPGETASMAAARTPAEELLAGIWSDVLGVEGIGVEQNFFDLGGHSLLATRVVSRVRSVFGVELPVHALFERPTVAGLAEALVALASSQRGLPVPPLVRVPREGRLPLSFAQQRLWFLDQLDPGSSQYNVPSALRLQGRLDVSVLRRVLTEVVSRHESLRTRFGTEEGEPYQHIEAGAEVPVPVIDLSGLEASGRVEEARRLGGDETRWPFDLTRGPLLRVVLLRLGEQEHAALVTVHHIISDGWSMGLLVEEVSALYRAFSQGLASPLAALPVQYADYAAWQRGWLQGEALEAELGYWRDRLAGAPALLELPMDRPRPAVQTHRGASQPVEFPAELSRSLSGLGRRQGATMFMTLLAGFSGLLSHYAAQPDICVGTPIAGRRHLETERLIGFFVNTLVLRSDLSGSPGFSLLLDRVRTVSLEAHEHQDLPFEKLVEELRPQRSLSHSPLFQVMLVVQNLPGGALDLGDVHLSPLEGSAETARFDLSLSLVDVDGRISGELTYNRDLFDAASAARLVSHLERLLEGAMAEPDRPVAELQLLSQGERAQLLTEWNDSREDFPYEACLQELFAAQVERSPQAVALVWEGGSLTYRGLAEKAEELARHLVSLGVGPDVPVAICAERSPEMVVGILAVLQAGGGYVPLDPDYPRERLELMIEDSGVPVLLTQRALAAAVSPCAARIVLLDGEWAEASGAAPLVSGASPENLAYIIYTSGSTGRPKGVMVHHRGAVNRLLWAQHLYPVTPADRILQKASFSFDFSVWEILGTLLAGARLVLAAPGGHRDAGYLVRVIREQQITLIHFVPSMLRIFLAEEGIEECTSLRYVFSGGEALPRDLEELFSSRLGATLRNQYGPTESSINATAWLGRPGSSTGPIVPIGRPIANDTVYVLGVHLQLLPIGVPGELFVGGIGVTRGYLGSPELTAERFVPDPFGAEPGSRLYRTGDRVRWLAQGDLEFLGRFDHQVKVRGFRIELGEVEEALRRHPEVRDVVVMVREHAGGDHRLWAYVVGDDSLEPGELRGFLERKLPTHMVPSGFVGLPALPLTPSGKVDRHALAAQAPEAAQVSGSDVPPGSPVERTLAEIWQSLLGVERIGIRTSFFDLGGHSLLATRVISRVRESFGIDIPLRTIFEAPTIESFAEVVVRQQVELEDKAELERLLAELEELPEDEAERRANE